MFAHLTFDACVAASGHSLTHRHVRSLMSSAAPGARNVIRANQIP